MQALYRHCPLAETMLIFDFFAKTIDNSWRWYIIVKESQIDFATSNDPERGVEI